MIKCSICSYQCDNWYVSNWRLACHIYFWLGKCPLELARRPSHVALAWHIAGGSIPFGVTTRWCSDTPHCLAHSSLSATHANPSPSLRPSPSLPPLLSLLSPLLYCPATNKIIKNIRRIRIEFLEKIWEKLGIVSCALWSNLLEFGPLLPGRPDFKTINNVVSLIMTSHRSSQYIYIYTINKRTAVVSSNFPARNIKSCLV